MALTPAESPEPMHGATGCGRILSVDHNYRFEAVVRQTRETFEAGRIGRLVSVELNYGFDWHDR